MLGLVLCLLPIAISGSDPCSVAQLIDDSRRSTNFTVANPTFDVLFCDRFLHEGWYKFIDDGKLATKCQPFYHCNTHFPLYLSTNHPTVPGQTVDGVVCSPGLGCDVDPCDLKLQIRVKNCQTFYAYYLVPTPGCHMAYCAGDKTPCQVHQIGYEPNCKDRYPLMLTNPHLSNPILTGNSPSGNATSFKFQCEVNFDPARNDVGFVITFAFDGVPDPNTTRTGANRTADLDQMQLRGHMGHTVSCLVQSFFLHPPSYLNGASFKSPSLSSNGYWAGIRVDKDRLLVTKKDPPQNLTMISTVPIVCPPPHDVTCQLDIELETFNNTKITVLHQCKVTFTPGMWNSTTNRAETTFQVSATRNGKNDKDKEIYLHFNTVTTYDAPPIFRGYQVPFVQIMNGNTKTAECWCITDPHCKTFDTPENSANILDYFLKGEFIMYKSTNRNFEVQVRTWDCNGKGPTCNCGVAMKERNEVFILDMCDSHYGTSSPRLTIPCMGARSNGTVVTHDNAGNVYLFSFPSGAQVKIVNENGLWLNVYIKTPEDDMQATEGICGYFDGNPDNDLKHSDGSNSAMPNGRFKDDDFVNSWRIKPLGSSIFDTKYFTVDPSLDHDMYYCKCDTNSNTTLADCTLNGNVARPNVQALLPGGTPQNPTTTCKNPVAHTRSANTILPDDYPADYVFDYGLTYVPILRADFPTENGKSRADAEAACNSAIDQNPILQQCVLRAGLDFAPEKSNCVEDYKYFDNGEFVRSNMLSAIMKCTFNILKNESFYDANDNLPAFISSDLCPAYDCNKHGSCTHGQCVCDAGYVGAACEIQSSMAPVLHGVVRTTWMTGSVLCDVTERMCETAYVYGNNLFDNPRLSCKVEVLKFDGHSFAPSGIQVTTAAIYKSMYEVGCKLPLKSTIGGQTVVAFNISVTNDASSYSNQVTYVRTDKRCARCIKTGESCSVKSGTCLIEGNCWTAGETNPSNCFQVCDPATNSTQWKIAHIISTTTTAGVGLNCLQRFDIWTSAQSGCNCSHDPGNYSYACCDAGGCQCQAPFQNQCTQCGKPAKCGSPQPAPEYGIDGYTDVFDDCTCQYNTTLTNCACCKHGINACQCGKKHRNQCVDCSHMEQCGSKPWIFGPPIIDP